MALCDSKIDLQLLSQCGSTEIIRAGPDSFAVHGASNTKMFRVLMNVNFNDLWEIMCTYHKYRYLFI